MNRIRGLILVATISLLSLANSFAAEHPKTSCPLTVVIKELEQIGDGDHVSIGEGFSLYRTPQELLLENGRVENGRAPEELSSEDGGADRVVLFKVSDEEKDLVVVRDQAMEDLLLPREFLAIVKLDRHVKIITVKGTIYSGVVSKNKLELNCATCGTAKASYILQGAPYCKVCGCKTGGRPDKPTLSPSDLRPPLDTDHID